MAVTRGKSPVIMTAQGDHLTDSTDTPRVWKVTLIRIENGANAGDVDITDADGQSVLAKKSLAANATESTTLGEFYPVDDLVLGTWQTGCVAKIFYM